MGESGGISGLRERRRRLFRFGQASFDETRWILCVRDRAVPVEGKPLAVLHELLLRDGEVGTKDELLNAVWSGADEPPYEASLATAVSKLRKALGPEAEHLQTVSKIGYRLGAPVQVEYVNERLMPRLAFVVGDDVPGRPQWRLDEALGGSGPTEVWRCVHRESGMRRVFRFADTAQGLSALRREVGVWQRLTALREQRRPTVTLSEWSFEAPPFFIEMIDGGPDLTRWAEEAGGLATVPLDRRLAIAAAAARALAVAHDAGIIHGGVGPTSIVVDEGDKVRLAGFWRAAEPEERVECLDYHAQDVSDEFSDDTKRDESVEASVAGDISALGVLFYQLVAGSFAREMKVGWEADVEDPLLRADIAAAAASSPDFGLRSAAELAERIDALDDRRARADAARIEAIGAQVAAEAERRRLARRPWIRAAAAALLLGFLGTGGALVATIAARDDAERQKRQAEAAFAFLKDDLLARVSPANADGAEETLTEAVLRAREEIDPRFEDQPMLAGQLHSTLASALHQRSLWDEARVSYKLADAAFARAGDEGMAKAAENRMTLAATEAASAQPGSLLRARALVDAERTRVSVSGGRAAVKMAQAEGLIAYFSDPAAAPAHFIRASELAQRSDDFTPVEKLQLRQSAAMARLRAGDAAGAEPRLRRVADEIGRIRGVDSPDALLAEGSALTAAAFLGRNAEASAGASRLLPRMERRFGSDHRYTLAIRSLRAQALAALGKFGDAAKDAAVVWRSALSREGQGQQSQIGELDLATYLCRSGRGREGERHARDARAHVLTSEGQNAPLTHAATFVWGECLAGLDRPDRALALYRTVNPDAVGAQVGDADWAPNLHLALAEAYLALGDRARARSAMAKVGRKFDAANADDFQRRRIDRLRKGL